MSGIPVVIAANGLGMPVKQVTSDAPVMTVAANGLGTTIVLSDRGSPFVVQGGGGPVYDEDAAAYFARRSQDPGEIYKGIVNDTIIALKLAGYWPRFKALYLSRDPVSRADARLEIKGNQAYDLTEVGTLSFTTLQGFTGDGATGMLETGFAFASGDRNSSSAGIDTDTEGGLAGIEIGADGALFMQVRPASGNALLRLHTTSNTTVGSVTTAIGHHIITRTASTVSKWLRNSVVRLTSSQASAVPTGATLKFLGQTPSPRRMRFAHIGDGLSDADAAAVSTILFEKYTSKVNALALMITAYGDSLTLGTGSSTTTYPAALAALTGRPVFNGGVGGNTVAQIKARWDADFTNPGSPLVIWAGRNDVATTLLTTAAATEDAIIDRQMALGSDKYIVLGVTNGWAGTEDVGSSNYNDIITFNTERASTHGTKFIDIRKVLYDLGAPGQPYADADAYSRGLTPTGLRGDASVHFNAAAYQIIAQTVYDRGKALGYWD